jgi:SAM-dependent methyltransferase
MGISGLSEAFQLTADLASLDDFEHLKSAQPNYFGEEVEQVITRHTQTYGIRTRFLGYVGPQEVHLIGDEPREHLQCRGMSSRQRAMLDAVLEFLVERSIAEGDAKIYGHEAITGFALLMCGRFPRFIGTEYCRTEQERAELFPIRHGDICDSEFPDASFHLVVSNDVLEHVRDIDAALRETARILKLGGRLLATFPFLFDWAIGVRFASLVDGKVLHHFEPIYHGNPMDTDGGSLVFEIPGWDIIDRARRAGFSRAHMRFVCDQDKGIVASTRYNQSPGGVLVAVFDK